MRDRTERFRAIFDECYQPLHGYVRRRCGLPDADDLVADILTVAWRRLDDIPPGSELPWLYGVAARTILNRQRTLRRRARLVSRLTLERPPEAGASDDAVLDALARLGPEDRELLQLAAWEQLRAGEIAVVMGCTPNAAALRLSRARARLRAAMTEMGPIRTETGRKDDDGNG